MVYKNKRIAEVAETLTKRLEGAKDKASVLRAVELKALFDELKILPSEQKAEFGKELNALKQELQNLADSGQRTADSKEPIDVGAPFAANTPKDKMPKLLASEQGSTHPLTVEMDLMLGILQRMGFEAVESRQIDNDYNMFTALNFPLNHPARDDYDTFMTEEGLIAPAHTSTMQNRILKAGKANLKAGKPIAAVIPGRVFRNEDLDARHEHTFHQIEGVYVDKGVNAGHLIATLKSFLQEYYGQELEVKTQPFYFPFTEPSFEFASSCPFCQKAGCSICSQTGWIELMGCGMIHPNVLKEAGIDPTVYTGFAWGIGVERPVMIKYGIEDIRHFEAGKLEFLRQFS